jgi:hypothetical protein
MADPSALPQQDPLMMSYSEPLKMPMLRELLTF